MKSINYRPVAIVFALLTASVAISASGQFSTKGGWNSSAEWAAPRCGARIHAAKLSTGSAPSPAPGTYELVRVQGPGAFVSASVSIVGGTGVGNNFVSLEADGQLIETRSEGGLVNVGFTSPNNSGVSVIEGPAGRSITVGYPTAISFQDELVLSVLLNDEGVNNMIGHVLHGK